MASRLRPSILAARQRLVDGRRKNQDFHDRGGTGVKVCARMTALVDATIGEIYDAVLDDLKPHEADQIRNRIALVAHGGYGRRELAPYSDIDLMILHSGSADSAITDFVTRISQDIYDTGEQLGQSVRTPQQAIRLARQDPLVGTSLLESRLLVGATDLHEHFVAAFKKMIHRRSAAQCREFIEARKAERHQYGESVYLLEPNIKRSRGGLRDLHLLRWLWFVKCGVAEPDLLHSMGVISKFDYRRLVSARSLLLRVRNDMHFHAKSSCDIVTRQEQIRLSAKLGYRGTSGLLPAEQFMRDYFHATQHVSSLAHRIAALVEPASTVSRVLEPVLGRVVNEDYRIGIREITATSRGRSKLKSRIQEVLKLVDLARLHHKWIAQDTWYLIYRCSPEYSRELDAETIDCFLDIMANPAQLGELLRRLHALGVLERIIPEFTHARCLLQFNQYHKYTVDEHCIRAVEEATHFAERSDLPAKVYNELSTKRTLHLVLLLHDLGKGFEEDHSEVGARVAQSNSARLNLPADEAETIAFLVLKHLRMSHIAFRRDTSQQGLIESFAKEVQTPERLAMLYLLSCADLSAVGPDVFNDWKSGVLDDLYLRTMQVLQPEPQRVARDRRRTIRANVLSQCAGVEADVEWFERQFDALPESYVAGRPADKVSETLRRLRGLQPRAGCAWGSYDVQTNTIEFTAGVDQGSGRGIFSSMAGIFTSREIEILAAETATLADGLLLQRYTVHDTESTGPPSEGRLQEISDALVNAIDSRDPPIFRSIFGRQQREVEASLANLPQEVRIDNNLSEDCTIIEVFTVDRRGLLYAIARALHNLRFIIKFAKIGTYLDQVVDVFYVTERNGMKPLEDSRIEEIRVHLDKIINTTD